MRTVPLAVVLGLVQTLETGASDHGQTPSLPGPFGVGTVPLTLTDSARSDPLAGEAAYRRLRVDLWYPSEPRPDVPGVLYVPSGTVGAGLTRFHLLNLGVVGPLDRTRRTHAIADATVAATGGPLPVLLFTPGYGVPPGFYRGIIEPVVSHGYVIAAISHPHESGAIRYTDGSVLMPQEPLPDAETIEAATAAEYVNPTLPDAGFVLDRLREMTLPHSLSDRIDLRRVGYLGHSLGASTAIEAARRVPDVAAAVSLDGWARPLSEAPDLSAPILFLLSDQDAAHPHGTPPDAVLRSPDRYLAVVSGSTHLSVVDIPYLVTEIHSTVGLLGGVEPKALRRFVADAVVAFFDRHLQPQPPTTGADLVLGEPPLRLEAGKAQVVHLPRVSEAPPAAPTVGVDPPQQDPDVAAAIDSIRLVIVANAESLRHPSRRWLTGRVVDAVTGQPVAGAIVQLRESFRGTVAGEDGDFRLLIPAEPEAVDVSRIGYRSRKLAVDDDTTVVVRLQPSAIALPPVVVTDEDPGVTIMRRVIERLPELRPPGPFQARAYMQQTLSNDTSVVSILETVADVSWASDRHSRVLPLALRGTRNESTHLFFSPGQFFDGYRDYMYYNGGRLLLPTHPDALEHYKFHLLGHETFDDRVAFRIAFSPRRRVNACGSGTLLVLDGEHAVLELDMRASDSFLMDLASITRRNTDVTFAQRYRPFGDGIWMPVDFRHTETSHTDLLGLPAMHVAHVGVLSDHRLGVALPDSFFQRSGTPDTVLVVRDSLFAPYPQPAYLTEEHLQAVAAIDSSVTLATRFPGSGLGSDFDLDEHLARRQQRQVSTPDSVDESPWRLRPDLWFHRVDGAHLGAAAAFADSAGLRLELRAGLSTAKRLHLAGLLRRDVGPGNLEVTWHRGSRPRAESALYSVAANTPMALLGVTDYFDYYESRGVGAYVGTGGEAWRTRVGLRAERHGSLPRVTGFDLLSRDDIPRPNAPIDEGDLRAVAWTLSVGERPRSLGRVQRFGSELQVEHSSRGLAASDFAYSRAQAVVDLRVPTLFRTKSRPNQLDLRAVAFASRGDLPVQRLGTIDTALGPLSCLGALRSVGGGAIEADHGLALFWEHDFRTAPFELLGAGPFTRRGAEVALHGAVARTWVDSRWRLSAYRPRALGSVHTEIGIALSARRSPRLLVTRRLGADGGWRLGVELPPAWFSR